MALDITYTPISDSITKAARQVILTALQENFGTLRMEYLADVLALPHSYQQPKLMLVGQYQQQMVSTGAIVPEEKHLNTWRIMRMCVSLDYRRKGLASKMLSELEQYALKQGAVKFILTTVSEWTPARLFYESRGYQYQNQEFQAYADQGGCWIVHYEKEMA